MALIISKSVAKKIAQPDHGSLAEKDVQECFSNHCGHFCYEQRPEHQDRDRNPTPWFVAETNQRRKLKIMFVRIGNDIELKSAYPASQRVIDIFNKFAKREHS